MLQTIQRGLGSVSRFGSAIGRWQLFGRSSRTGAPVVWINTPRLSIRDAVPTDLDPIYDYMTQEPFCRRQHLNPPSRTQVAALLRYCKRQQLVDPRSSYSLVVALRLTDAIIGHARLVIGDWVNHQGELSFDVDWRYGAQQFETEIGATMLRFGFETLRLHRIVARCDVEDLARSRIFEGLGMRPEGMLRDNIFADGRWWSSYQWSLLAHETQGALPAAVLQSAHGALPVRDDRR